MFNTYIVELDNQIANRALKVKASKNIVLLQILNCSFNAVGERSFKTSDKRNMLKIVFLPIVMHRTDRFERYDFTTGKSRYERRAAARKLSSNCGWETKWRQSVLSPPGEWRPYTFCSQCVEMFSPRVLLSLIVKAWPPRICDWNLWKRVDIYPSVRFSTTNMAKLQKYP